MNAIDYASAHMCSARNKAIQEIYRIFQEEKTDTDTFVSEKNAKAVAYLRTLEQGDVAFFETGKSTNFSNTGTKIQAEKGSAKLAGTDRSDLRLAQILLGCTEHLEEINKKLTEVIDRPLELVGLCEHAILVLVYWEAFYSSNVPDEVLLSECYRLTQRYCNEDSHKLVYGIVSALLSKRRDTA